MSYPLYKPVNENENHLILVLAFPKTKRVNYYDPLKTDWPQKKALKRKASEKNVLNELL